MSAPDSSVIRHSSLVIPRRSRSGAFTLIELLTVIAIIGILAAILIPTIGKVRETATKAACASNLRQLALGTMAYAEDNRGNLPLRPIGMAGGFNFPHAFVSADWDVFRSYVGNPPKDKLMFCPGPIKQWRNPESLGYAPVGPTDSNYGTYGFYANLPLTPAAQSGYGLSTNTLQKLINVPARFPLWTCLTCTTSDGRFHGHSDPDSASFQGQNSARADASVRWVKGTDLVPYYSNAGVTFYGPTPSSL